MRLAAETAKQNDMTFHVIVVVIGSVAVSNHRQPIKNQLVATLFFVYRFATLRAEIFNARDIKFSINSIWFQTFPYFSNSLAKFD